MSRAEYITREKLEKLLPCLTADNRLVVDVMLSTGLRISDVLSLRRENIRKRMTVVEQKTGKRRRIYLREGIYQKLKGNGGSGWCFPHARDASRHRTRQAVWKDIRKAARLYGYDGVSPHSCRKVYAVNHFARFGIDSTRNVLNHDSEAVTLLYALSDVLSARKKRKSKKNGDKV